MGAEGNLDCNLNDNQRLIVEDTCVLLKPFMYAQGLQKGSAMLLTSWYPTFCTGSEL
jgi:hypothetical protein